VNDFLTFLEQCPTPWHTTEVLAKRMKKGGAKELFENEAWKLQKGKSYYFIRSGTLVAFHVPKKNLKKALIVASHTDSPALRLKHNAAFDVDGMEYLRTEPYGGISPMHWFDRDLMIAGRLFTRSGEKLVSYPDKIATIPSLPPHLKEMKEKDTIKIDRQKELLALFSEKKGTFDALTKQPLSFDLLLVPAELPQLVGANGEFVAAYRLDNLSSVYPSLTAFEKAKPHDNKLNMAIFWNHEEIGSATNEGAASSLLEDTLKRVRIGLGKDEEMDYRLKAESLILSVDVSQAYHPSHSERFDAGHKNPLGKGFAIKFDAAKAYATDAKECAGLIATCKKHKIAYQVYARHSNIRCGSTVGPKMALSSIPALDIGIPIASMHATRELASINDIKSLNKLIINEIQS